jgi:DNA-binding MarR family transcriptional regulator
MMKSNTSQIRPSVSPPSTADLPDIFMQLHQKVGCALRKESKHLPFTISQLEALRFLVEHPDSTMKDIAAQLTITAPSATAMIEQLAEKKLIRRTFDPDDRRTVRVMATAKATKLFDSFKETKIQIFREILRNISDQDRKQLTAILQKLI